jgi:hypothetical protein
MFKNIRDNYRIEFLVIVGYLLIFGLSCGTIWGIYYFAVIEPKQHPITHPFVQTLPASPPTPHIPANYSPPLPQMIFRDSFDTTNENKWISQQPSVKIEVNNGHLGIKLSRKDSYAITSSSFVAAGKYYIETEFITSQTLERNYGIVFGIKNFQSDFFLFEISPEEKYYYFYQRIKGKWTFLFSGQSNLINSGTNNNVLGVYVSENGLEFYINTTLVDYYFGLDINETKGEAGIYTDGSDQELLVPYFFISSEEKK